MIRILDNVHCRIEDRQEMKLIKPCLSYPYVFWRPGQYHRIRKEARGYLISKDGIFLSGFIPRIKQYARENGIELSWKGQLEYLDSARPPSLKNLTLRPDQIQLINLAIKRQRGVIQAPTGIGKTVLALGLISCFPGRSVLILCRETGLMDQTYAELKKEFDSIGRYGGKFKDGGRKIIVSTAQSFVRLDPILYCDAFDIVIVDECDLGSGLNSQLYKIMTRLLAPVRIGLSATLPESELNKLVLEGLLGPVIGQMTVQEGIDKGLLAKPRIKIIPLPYNHRIRELRRYQDVYEAGIVNNETRNSIIINTAQDFVSQGKSCLILVTRIDHGNNLVDMAGRMGWEIPFVWGETETEERTLTRLSLQAKETMCVVANAVYKRGINFPSLDVVIDAAGEKSERATIQRIGRGFRTSPGKEEFVIVDFFDESHPFLISHFGHRFSLFCEEGWV